MAGSQENYQLFNNTYLGNAHNISVDLNERNTESWYKPKWERGEVFQDISESGKDRNWRKRKLSNLSMYDAFEIIESRGGIAQQKLDRLYRCADVLMYEAKNGEYPKLKRAFFCKNKLCPICNWRRSLKHSYMSGLIIDKALEKEPKARFVFLTLTVKNVVAQDLKNELRKLTKGFDRLFKRAKVKRNLIGYMRATEVTYNSETKEYHPHLHILLLVKSTYFKGKDNYIEQDEWTALWQQSMKLSYVPVVNVKVVRPGKHGLKKAVLETAKYPVKPLNFKEIGDTEIVSVVSTLYYALGNTRQLAYGGLLKQIYQNLNLDEENFVNVSDDGKADDTVGAILFSAFDYNRRNYFWMNKK